MRWLLLAFLAVFLAPAAPLRADDLAALQSAPEFTVHYELYTGGLRTLGIDAKAQLEADRYALTADIHSLGFLNWLFSYHARHQAGGHLIEGGIRPDLYANSGVWNGGSRSVTLSYGSTGPLTVEALPPATTDEREPVPTDLWAHTVDPLSLVLAVNRQADAEAPCSVTVPVFDGRRRYNLHLTPLGAERLQANSYSFFAGEALRCRVVWERLAGESHKPEWQAKRPPLTTVWLARFGKRRLWLPVRLETESGFGHVVGHMTQVGAASASPALD